MPRYAARWERSAVVYGDIGTSVLYAFRECLSFGVSQHSEGILGILSLIIWTLILLGTVKYLTFVTRADNHGEGGILALLSLAFPESISEAAKPKLAAVMIVIGVAGAALLLWRWRNYTCNFGPFRN